MIAAASGNMNRLPGFLRRKKGAKGQVVKPASPQKQQQQDEAYVDTDGGQSDVRCDFSTANRHRDGPKLIECPCVQFYEHGRWGNVRWG